MAPPPYGTDPAPVMLPNQQYIKKEYDKESFQRRYSLRKATESALRESQMMDEVRRKSTELKEAKALQDALRESRRPSSTGFRKSYRRISIAKPMPAPRGSQFLQGVMHPGAGPRASRASLACEALAATGRPSVFVNQAGQTSPVNMVPDRPSGYIDIPRPSIKPPPPQLDNLNQSLPWSRGGYGAGLYAGQLMQGLFAKDWEQGGHAHNFCGMCRGSTCDDIPRYYEQEPGRLARHNAIVAALNEWNKQRQLKADMTHQLCRLHSIAKTRRQFQLMRKHVKYPPGTAGLGDPALLALQPILFPESWRDDHIQADLGKVKVDMLGHVDVGWHHFDCPHYMFPLLPCSRARPNKPPARPKAELLLAMKLNPTADPIQPAAPVSVDILDLDRFDRRLEARTSVSAKSTKFQPKQFKG